MTSTTYSLLRSRTFWTGVVMFAITWLPIIGSIVPQQWKPLVDALLTLLMFYFHGQTAAKAGATN